MNNNKASNIENAVRYVPDKIWNPVFISVFLANMFLNLSKQMVNTLIARYADVLGATSVMVGFVSSAFAITALLFKLISGPVNDSLNRKYVLMFSSAIMAISYIGYGSVSTVSGLIGFRLLQGSGQAFTATVCLALASDALPPSKFSAGIGYFSLAAVVCQTIGPTIGLALVDVIGYSATFYIASGVMFLAAFAALFIKTPHTSNKKFVFSIKNVFAVEALLPATMMMLLSMAYSCVNAFLIIFASRQGINQTSVGLYFTVYAVAMLFTRPFVGKLSDKYGMVKTFLPALGCYAAAFLMISVSTNIAMLLTAAVISAFGYGTCQPSVQTLCMKCVTKDHRGAASSTNYIGDDLGNMIGPVLSGTFVSHFGYSAMWRLMIIPVAIVAVIVVLFRKKINKIEKDFLTANK